ncbi:MAG: molybdopterin oxidoreductase family protein [Chromatiales bacterium]|nr:molybdopterin oxidoreductase family protein [Chromatiales bacterium]
MDELHVSVPPTARARAERVASACPHDCPSTCALEVERLDARTIGRIYGAAANDYTAGTLCAKVARYAERVHHPDRLATPLERIGPHGCGRDGFRSISWERALDRVADHFAEAAARHGPETVWPHYFAGTMGLVQRDSIERFRHVLGYSRQHSTICTPLVDNGWIAGTGAKRGVDPREIADSDLIVVWGGNPVSTQVNVMHHIARARRERGAYLVVVDPYRSPTAEKADLHLMPRPGTDGALACAVMHVLFAEGFADRDYLARHTDAPDDLERHLATRTPAWASAITGIPVDTIVDFARRYGATPRAFIRLGYGFARSRNGSAQVHAVSCLPAVTGAWRHRGGGALYSNAALYPVDSSLIMGLDARDTRTRVLDQSRIGPILCGDEADLKGGPPVTALLVQNTNPAAVSPESHRVRAGLARDDLFVCVHEQFLTDTARMADIVLPATTFLEHDDMYRGGGHVYFQVTRAVIEPYAEARSNHWVLCELARRLGADHPGFRMTAWELVEETLRRSGMPDAETLRRARWHDFSAPFETMHYLDGFGHPDGRFRFRPDWSAFGPDHAVMPALPDHLDNIDAADDERPFRMVTAPARHFLNTTFTETPTSRRLQGRPTVLIHPRDGARLGLTDGARTRVGNRRGSVVVHARLFDGLQPGVVVVESVWPNDAFEEGIGINALVSADRGPPGGGAVFHDTAVWLRPA